MLDSKLPNNVDFHSLNSYACLLQRLIQFVGDSDPLIDKFARAILGDYVPTAFEFLEKYWTETIQGFEYQKEVHEKEIKEQVSVGTDHYMSISFNQATSLLKRATTDLDCILENYINVNGTDSHVQRGIQLCRVLSKLERVRGYLEVSEIVRKGEEEKKEGKTEGGEEKKDEEVEVEKK